jgi:putative membrane protein
LRGGITLVAILGVIIVNLRDIVIDTVFSDGRAPEGDPLVWVFEHDFVGVGLAIIVGLLLLFIAGFYFSWRMHTFRITDEVVEVRTGILFRTNRKGRLDRIQGINIVRPFLARIFGAAKLEVNVAGQDANIKLEYLGSAASDELRVEVLRLASGKRVGAAVDAGAVQLDENGVPIVAAANGSSGVVAGASGLIEQRMNEFLAPELDPTIARPESVVTMHPGRLIGSIVLSGSTVVLIGIAVGVVVGAANTGSALFLIGLLPAIIGFAGFYVSRFTKSLRYSIAGTPDGVRVGFGLFTTSNETLPPGRIHSIQVSQPLMWRPFGWWEIKVNRASSSSTQGAGGQANTTILPVGNRTDVMKVLELLLPDLTDEVSLATLNAGLDAPGGHDGFTTSPKRAVVLRWFSWRRNGFAFMRNAVVLRKGAIWRELVVVPLARMQSVGMRQGPLLRSLRLASVQVHTVAGPIIPAIGALDAADVESFFAGISDAATASSWADTSHHWGRSEQAL